MQRSIYLRVPEQLLELLDRHAFSDCHRCHGSPELVRMNMVGVRGAAQLCEKAFHTGYRKASPRGGEADEQRGIGIPAGGKIVLQMDLSPGVEINPPFLVALSQNNAFPLRKIDVRAVEIDQFPDTDSR